MRRKYQWGEKNTLSVLAFTTLFIGLVTADWNILHQRKKRPDVVGTNLKNFYESWRINVELNNVRDFEVVPQECTQYIGKYVTSSQYKADLENALEEFVELLFQLGTYG